MPPYRSASGSVAEDLFIELFSETFGAEKAGYLYSQYHFYDIYQNSRYADFVLENGYFEKYRELLCALCIENVYLSASVRVLKADASNPLLKEFRNYTQQQFPEYKNNKYMANISSTRKLAYKLLELKLYKLLAFLFRLRG